MALMSSLLMFGNVIFSRSNALRLTVVLFASQLALADINYIGCFNETPNRLLNGLGVDYRHDFPKSYLKTAAMTPESCGRFCGGLGYKYCGVEFGDQCYCGSHLPASMDVATCDTQCAQHPSEKCGGTWALQMYSITPPRNPPMCALCAMSCDWCASDPRVIVGCAVGAAICASTAIIPPLALVCEAIDIESCGIAIGSRTLTCAIAEVAKCACSNHSQYC